MITIDQVRDKRNLTFYATINGKEYRARQTGKVKTWVTRPLDFKIPVKYGLYTSFYIDNLSTGENNAELWELR